MRRSRSGREGRRGGWSRWCLLAVVVALLVATPRPASAQVQVSDMARKLAKRIVREIGVSQIKKACAGGEHAELCEDFAGMLGEFAVAAIEGEVDSENVLEQFRDFATRALVTVALDELANWVGDNLIDPSTLTTFGTLNVSIEESLRCLARDVVSRDDTRCKALTTMASTLRAAIPADAVSKVRAAVAVLDAKLKKCDAETNDAIAALCFTRAAVEFIAEYSPGLKSSLGQFETIAGVLERVLRVSKRGLLFPATVQLVAAFDELDEYLISSPNVHTVWDSTSIDAPSCSKVGSEINAFKSKLAESYEANARAIVRGLSIDDVEPTLRVPWDPTCADTGPWWRAVRGFRFQARLSASVHRFEVPVLVAAALVDYLRSNDEAQLLGNAKQVLRVLVARWVGAQDSIGTRCTQTSSGGKTTYDCTSSSGKFTIAPTGVTPVAETIVESYVEARFGLLAGQRNCVVQLLDGLLGVHQIVVHKDGAAVEALCWLDESASGPMSMRKADFDALLAVLDLSSALVAHPAIEIKAASGTDPVTIMRWEPGLLLAAVDPPPTLSSATHAYRRIRVSPQLDPEALLRVVEDLLNSDGASEEARIALRVVRAFIAKDPRLVVSVILETAADALEEPIARFVGRLFCATTCEKDDASPRCIVRAVALAFFEPLTQVISGASTNDQFVSAVARRLANIEPLDHSIFLFEVGLAYSSLYVDPEKTMNTEWSQHVTVLDKWGIAAKGKYLQAGLFVGGFIDAVIKTASNDEDEDDARWLVGGTLGLRKLGSIPIGLSIHATWAPPIDWDNSKNAWILGGAINVPLDFVLED